MAQVTVIFADLTGSTRLFETQGNDRAARAVTEVTQWIGQACHRNGGHVVKFLGDGVLMLFADNEAAVQSVIEMQRGHTDRLRHTAENLRMHLKIGLARGDVVEQDSDCYGDAVNVAARLSDLAVPEQILATDSVVDALRPGQGLRALSLGPIELRGRADPCVVYRIEWHAEVLTAFLTVAADLPPIARNPELPMIGIQLSSLERTTRFRTSDFPIFLGRDSDAHFIIKQPSVSRLHARIEWRGGSFILEDMSSNGTWVRFDGNPGAILLRRQECVLHGPAELSLGAAFEEPGAPTVGVELVSSSSG